MLIKPLRFVSHRIIYTPCVNVFIITIVCLQPTLEIITCKILQMIPRNTFFFPVHLTRKIRGPFTNSLFHIDSHTITNTHTLPSLYPTCQMYRYDAYWLPTGPIEASWECRLAGCWLCSHGNWLEPCVWPHEGHIKAGLQKHGERGGKCPCVFWGERDRAWLKKTLLNPVQCVFAVVQKQSPLRTYILKYIKSVSLCMCMCVVWK